MPGMAEKTRSAVGLRNLFRLQTKSTLGMGLLIFDWLMALAASDYRHDA
jgi:hypothetical protein